MDARQLLERIEARGGVATVKRDGGPAKINVTPRGVALELATEIQRFKPALLELLERRHTKPPETAPERAQIGRAGSCGPATANGPQNGFKVPSNATARARVRSEIRRVMPDADVLATGRALLLLDAGWELEPGAAG